MMKAIKHTLTWLIMIVFFHGHLFSQLVHGDLKQWHKVMIDFEGPQTSETGIPNPFTDYRLDVILNGPGGQTYTVPGFYAVDGDAAETSADSGNVWRVNFCPDELGTWNYTVSFVQGDKIAAELTGGESAGYMDGATGDFEILIGEGLSDKDFRSQGKLVYADDHYLQFMGSEEYFIKVGANSPEVFLEYSDFDNTPSSRTYNAHITDWNEGDPVWQDDKGKGIIGAINYLSETGVNAFYFLLMNAYGDGKKAWPWIDKDSLFVYDCSKLDQWEKVFEHMTQMGVMPHFVLTETENESFFEIEEDGAAGGFALSRKIYFREMVARFAHHPTVTWNVGEENGWADGSGYKIANTDEQRKQFCARLRDLTYYSDHISIHNGPSTDDGIFDELLGWESLTGPAFQWGYNSQIHGKILEWRNNSNANGHKWVVSMDEAWLNPATGSMTTWRKEVVWGTFMAGGAGVELYIGAGLDLQVQDFRPYEDYYSASVLAAEFFKNTIPFQEMAPDDDFAEDAWALTLADSTYLLYLKNGGSTNVSLPDGIYNVQWFDPRDGGELQTGSVLQVMGNGSASIGVPPNNVDSDWACLITSTDSLNSDVHGWNPESTGFDLQHNYPNPF
ncbi:DUF5060 domain-containing protein, partial [candidate division KSB1 bacterium]|nr:DUF5060 domain-containing protein [candidate division KSB1 bacterium]